MSKFHERINQLREEKGEKQATIATKLDITPQALSYYLKGGREPNYDLLIKIAEYFGCSIDYLLGLTDMPNEERSIKIPIPLFEKVIASEDEIVQLCQDYFNALGVYATLPENEKAVFADMIKEFIIILDRCKTIGNIDNLMGQTSGIIELHEAATNLLIISAKLTEQAFVKYYELNGGKPKRGMWFLGQPPKKED